MCTPWAKITHTHTQADRYAYAFSAIRAENTPTFFSPTRAMSNINIEIGLACGVNILYNTHDKKLVSWDLILTTHTHTQSSSTHEQWKYSHINTQFKDECTSVRVCMCMRCSAEREGGHVNQTTARRGPLAHKHKRAFVCVCFQSTYLRAGARWYRRHLTVPSCWRSCCWWIWCTRRMRPGGGMHGQTMEQAIGWSLGAGCVYARFAWDDDDDRLLCVLVCVY